MKKLKSLIVLLCTVVTISGLAACAQPNISNSEDIKKEESVDKISGCTITAVENGVKLTWPKDALDGTGFVQIFRRRKGENWDHSYYMKKYKKNENTLFDNYLVDEFINENQEYDYKIELYNNTSQKSKVSDPLSIKAPNGFGELVANENFGATYKDGIFTFTEIPSLKNVNDTKFSTTGYCVEYSAENGKKVFSGEVDNNQNTIDMTKGRTIWDTNYLDKTLDFSGVYCLVVKNDVTYKVNVKNSKGKIPSQITVPNLEPKITVVSTEQGLEITIETSEALKSKIKDADAIWLFKSDENRQDCGSIKKEKWDTTTIVDSDVEKGKSYSYEIQWRKGEDKIFTCSSTPLVKSDKGGK